MDIRKIKKLIELLEESDLNEIEISEGEETIRLSRSLQALPTEPTKPSALTVSNDPSTSLKKTSEVGQGAVPILSPMVGTFYAGPDPRSAPYVETDSAVTIGDTLCVIEAMKIFNQVETEITGIIRKILKNSGDPVEYGETLFLVEAPTEEITV
jgi:acetyl-CoA carboxylase biotin carboxyl carrier protein